MYSYFEQANQTYIGCQPECNFILRSISCIRGVDWSGPSRPCISHSDQRPPRTPPPPPKTVEGGRCTLGGPAAENGTGPERIVSRNHPFFPRREAVDWN